MNKAARALVEMPASVELTSYDAIVVNSSAGKDSQAMLDYIVQLARAAGVLDRALVVHCDLGRVEWKGTRELAEKQARSYGLRFEVVSNPKDLLVRIEERRQFPDNKNRYCTSEQKTGQVMKLCTALVREWRARTGEKRPMRILNCLGLRADESPARAEKLVFELDAASNSKRTVHRWLPIHGWNVARVWERIKQSGVPHHPAYDLGMPRLSCCFCVLASRSALVLAAQHNPELAQTYVELEARIGHRFQDKTSIAEIVEEAKRLPIVTHVDGWNA